jgi:hypothetical protein
MTDLIKLVDDVFFSEENIVNYSVSYQKLQRRYFSSNKNPNKYAWKKIIGELKKAVSLNLISIVIQKIVLHGIYAFLLTLLLIQPP